MWLGAGVPGGGMLVLCVVGVVLPCGGAGGDGPRVFRSRGSSLPGAAGPWAAAASGPVGVSPWAAACVCVRAASLIYGGRVGPVLWVHVSG